MGSDLFFIIGDVVFLVSGDDYGYLFIVHRFGFQLGIAFVFGFRLSSLLDTQGKWCQFYFFSVWHSKSASFKVSLSALWYIFSLQPGPSSE